MVPVLYQKPPVTTQFFWTASTGYIQHQELKFFFFFIYLCILF